MRKVKVPDFMQPFEVIVNGVKHVFPAGETVTVEDYIADIIERSVPPKAEAKVERVMWEDIGNRPFREEVVLGDTLYWDGNTEGLESVDLGDGGLFYYISPQQPSLDSYSLTLSGGGESFTYTEENYPSIEIIPGITMVAEIIFVVEDEVVGKDIDGIVFSKAGIYAAPEIDNAFFDLLSLTIPGYKGFETTTIKTIETKYLPEQLHFGTETKVVEGDTLTWDGNTEGLASPFPNAYKVSNVVLTDADLAKTWTLMLNTGDEHSAAPEMMLEAWKLTDFVLYVPPSGIQLEQYFIPRGLYFANVNGVHPSSLTIPGYGKFVSEQTVVKPLDEKYMPVLTSPNGTKFKISVGNDGSLSAEEV